MIDATYFSVYSDFEQLIVLKGLVAEHHTIIEFLRRMISLRSSTIIR